MRTYPINPDEHYGWLTGTTHDGRQILAADTMNLFFDSDGEFLSLEDLARVQSWKRRANDLIAVPGTIHVREFTIAGRPISVRPRPADYEAFLRDPTSFTEADQSRYPGLVSDWDQNGLFEFCLGDDFWMAADGSVSSH